MLSVFGRRRLESSVSSRKINDLSTAEIDEFGIANVTQIVQSNQADIQVDNVEYYDIAQTEDDIGSLARNTYERLFTNRNFMKLCLILNK